MIWYTEPRLCEWQRTLILEVDGRRIVCPLINSLEWSVKACLEMIENKD